MVAQRTPKITVSPSGPAVHVARLPRAACLISPRAWYCRRMSRACGHSLERGFCLGLAGLCVCLGCSSDFSATGGGSGSGNAGAAASHTGDGGSDETAGRPSTAGAAAGGAGAVGGGGSGSGHGGKGTCEIMECFVANTCVDKCGGNVVYTGCCACEPPSVNKLTCAGTP